MNGPPPPASRRTLLHMSDLHFGALAPGAIEALLELVDAQQPDVLVLSGDLTQRATADQFAAARAFVDRWPAPSARLLVPGNHDLPWVFDPRRWLRPYGGWRDAFGGDREPSLDAAGWSLVAVDTTRVWRHQHGTLSARQRHRVAQRLADARATRPTHWRIVVSHHPLAVARAADADDRPRGHAAACEAWLRAGMHVQLCGHVHVPGALPVRSGDGSAHGWIVGAGTGASTRTSSGHPTQSVNVLVADGAGLRFEQWDHEPKRRAFVKVLEAELFERP